ncbi:MAG: PDGLE domain-containing protein [Actinomycetota bacterium]
MSKTLKRFYLYFFSASILVAGVLSFYASSSPDGLEKVAEDKGFLENAKNSATANSPLSDYGVSGISHERLSVGLAGIIGVLVTALIAFGMFYLVKRMNKGVKS